jgi:hypothetical protein
VASLVDSGTVAVPRGTHSGSVTITPTSGDILVVKTVSSSAFDQFTTISDTAGNTWVQRAYQSTQGSACIASIWTAVAVNSSSTTVTVENAPGVSARWSVTAEVWRTADLPVTPATVVATGTGSAQTTLITAANNSVVSWLDGDYIAVDPTGYTFNTTSGTPVEVFLDYLNGGYSAYYAYETCSGSGSQTIGITSPGGQTWTILGIEVLDVPGPDVPDRDDQYDRMPWH